MKASETGWSGRKAAFSQGICTLHEMRWSCCLFCSRWLHVLCVLCLFFVTQNVFLFPALSSFLLWVFWFVLSCSFLLFVHEAQARAACCPFDDISAQLMLARLWNRSSCNMGPPQQVSHPASVLSPCTHPEEPACLQCHDCNSSQPEVICNLPPVTLSHRREEGLDSLSYGKYSGSRLPLAFPHLDTSSAKHFNRVRWAAVYSLLHPPQHDRKRPCGTDVFFLKKCQLYEVELVALILPICGKY